VGDPLELTTLIERCRAGDELAWEAFVRRYQARIYGLACTYTSQRDEAADLAQEIFVRLFETRARWAPADQFVPWMLQVARNRAVDFLRRRRSRRPPISVPVEDVPLAAEPGDGPEARALGHARRGQLRAALARLSQLSREVLVLRDIQGLSVEETARILGVPTGTVKSRSSRARAELAERMIGLARGGSGA
jgi:RNA polymerase sigma-70 factor (ECF subfamily)